MDLRYHKVQWGNAPRVRTGASTWHDPIRWQKQAEKDGDRPFVFCASLADIFDNQVPAEWRADAFEVMRKTPNLVYLLLTKRPQNIVKLAEAAGGLPRNAAIGTTIEDQKRADINETALVNAAAEVLPLFTFVSIEPMIGPVRLRHLYATEEQPRIDWVITGGETDQGAHKARPTHPEWFRSLRRQAEEAGAAFHHKQNGEWVPWIPRNGNPDSKPIMHVMENGSDYYPGNFSSSLQSMIKIGKKASGRMLDGVTYDAFPEVRANV